MYEEHTRDTILQRMLQRVPGTIDKREGSPVFNALAPAAEELYMMYVALDYWLVQTYGEKAAREWLELRVAERRVYPEPATRALLLGEFLPADLELAVGARFSLEEYNYQVEQKVEAGRYQLRCEEAGSGPNATFGTLVPIEYIGGLKAATLVELLVPGEDVESSESLWQRYLGTFETKAFGGNKKDYIQKTNAMEGVGATRVTRHWSGYISHTAGGAMLRCGGTVKLTILGADYLPASATLVELVQNKWDPLQDGYGDGLAPIGHIVTVESAEAVALDFTATLTLADGYTPAGMLPGVRAVFEAYLDELRRAWRDEEDDTPTVVRIAQLEARVLALPGVVDIRASTLGGGDGNVELGRLQVPVAGEVTL